MAERFTVKLPGRCRAEHEYAIDVLLGEFLGIPFDVDSALAEGDSVELRANGRRLSLPQHLFATYDHREGGPIYDAPPVRRVDLSALDVAPDAFADAQLPMPYGEPAPDGSWVSFDEDGATLRADVLGSSFFFLTRLEEVGSTASDEYELFPPESSFAWHHGAPLRPLVDEYTELLWGVLQQLWPGVERRRRSHRVDATHDVDRPRAYDQGSLRDRLWLVRHHAHENALPRLAGSRVVNGAAAVLGLPHRDPFDTFERLMDTAEGAGVRAVFYFLCGGTTRFDATYEIDSPPMRRLLRRVHERGHDIGLHGSYATMTDVEQLAAERERLTATLQAEGLPSNVRMCRQHYLRWRAPVTWCAQETVGLSIDASVGYSTAAGFRCGTAHEFPVFDVNGRRRLDLRERPLHIMDRALQALPDEQACDVIDTVRREAVRHDGTVGVLWHNSTFAESPSEWPRYLRALTGAG